jgi:thiol-disulfide isomerase/thioredoxin
METTILQDKIALLLAESLEKAIDYTTYRKLIQGLVDYNSNSGLEKTEALANYTQLNNKRMKRWDKTLKFPEGYLQSLPKVEKQLVWLVITESWCGDAAPSIPVISKVAEAVDNLELQLVFRDENPELMDQFLTNGSKSIPKLIMLEKATNKVLGTWGPRSTKPTAMVKSQKENYGLLTAEFKQDLQVFYNKDKGEDVFKDLRDLLLALK